MGDRTSVSLWVMNDDAEKTMAHIDEMNEYVEIDNCSQFTEFIFSEVNYGELDIYSWARSQGIPYSYRWDAGGEYGPGFQHLRFNSEGDPVFTEFSEEDLQVDPEEVSALLLKAETLDNAREAYSTLRSFLKPFTQSFLPLKWDTQKQNKRLARTVNLISGS